MVTQQRYKNSSLHLGVLLFLKLAQFWCQRLLPLLGNMNGSVAYMHAEKKSAEA